MESQGTKSFTVDELKCKCCGVFGMRPAFLEKLQELRDLYNRPISVLSAFRCSKHNAEVGGALDSQHLNGNAADIAISSLQDRYRLVGLAIEAGFKGIGIASNYVHVDYRLSPTGLIWLYPAKAQ